MNSQSTRKKYKKKLKTNKRITKKENPKFKGPRNNAQLETPDQSSTGTKIKSPFKPKPLINLKSCSRSLTMKSTMKSWIK